MTDRVRGSLAQQRKVRRWHRWIALVTSVQLLLWTLSGVYFAFIDIDYVRGSQFKRSGDAVAFNFSDIDLPAVPASELTLKERLPGEVIIGLMTEEGILWLDRKGEVLKPLTVEQAITLASSATHLTPDRAEWLDSDVAGSEYRGAALPLWQLWDSESPTRIAYMDALSGDVVAVRHDAWRWWDLLWSLHIMSYGDRDTIGTWLLKLFSLLALATAVLGLWLFFQTRRSARP